MLPSTRRIRTKEAHRASWLPAWLPAVLILILLAYLSYSKLQVYHRCHNLCKLLKVHWSCKNWRCLQSCASLLQHVTCNHHVAAGVQARRARTEANEQAAQQQSAFVAQSQVFTAAAGQHVQQLQDLQQRIAGLEERLAQAISAGAQVPVPLAHSTHCMRCEGPAKQCGFVQHLGFVFITPLPALECTYTQTLGCTPSSGTILSRDSD